MSGLLQTKHRCSLCGLPCATVDVWDAASERHVPITLQCAEHPEAPVLAWDIPTQAACVATDVHLRNGDTIDDVRAIVAGWEDSSRRATYEVALYLMERWERLPERRPPAGYDSERSPDGLFGPRRKVETQ
ncbi:MAG: hypothetical protein ACR2HN_09105 [Tepidiformaceae bacterium]